MVRELLHLRRAGGSALHLIADMLSDSSMPEIDADASVEATIIFADIENFSDLVAREGDEVATDVLDALDAAVVTAIGDTSCRVVKRLGDGVMLSTEDAGDGVTCAALLPHTFADAMSTTPHSLRLRVGAHHGVVRQRGQDLIGYHVNVAARIAEKAGGGTTLITGPLFERVRLDESIVVVPRGPLVAKGVPERPAMFELRAAEISTATG